MENPHLFTDVLSTVAEVTNGADGTYLYYLDLETFDAVGLQLLLNGGSGTVTVTVEASLQDATTGALATNYVDITNTMFGAASYTASAILFDSAELASVIKWLKIKVVAATTGANDADWSIYSYRRI